MTILHITARSRQSIYETIAQFASSRRLPGGVAREMVKFRAILSEVSVDICLLGDGRFCHHIDQA